MSTLWFICTGAINRSPAAMVIWNSYGLPLRAETAATGTSHGHKITGRMRLALEAAGYQCPEDYRSRWLSEVTVTAGDPIWVMQPSHLKAVRMSLPGSYPRLLSRLIGLRKIPDPHFNSSKQACTETIVLLQQALPKLRSLLCPTIPVV